MSAFQVMPPLSAEEYAALRDDIAERGIVVPVVVDQHGRLLDGHHRRRIADELQIDCPVEVRQVADDEDARNVAFTLNLARRHLTREQRRDLIVREAAARPGDSDRAIARRLGCSPSTVAAVRRPVSKLDTSMTVMESAEAVRLTEIIRTGLAEMDDTLFRLPRLDAIRLLTDWWREFENRSRGDQEFLEPIRRHIYQPRLDVLLTVTG